MDRNMEMWLEYRLSEMKSKKTLSVGILGGTFDPVHNGHLELAKAAMKTGLLDGIFLMPNHLPGYKTISKNASNADRVKMIRLAVSNEPDVGWSDFELKRGGITYTADTLALLHAAYPKVSWYFVMGGDSVLQFETWKSPELILEFASLIVTTRAEAPEKRHNSEDAVTAQVHHLKEKYPDSRIVLAKLPEIYVSSSEIRENIKKGSIREELIPAAAAEYIRIHNLYQD